MRANAQPLKLAIVLATIGQLAAVGVVTVSSMLYSKLTTQEAWPILIPSVCTALAIETLVISACLAGNKRISRTFKISLVSLMSWLIGVAIFVVIDPCTAGCLIRPPFVSWIASTVALSMMLRRFRNDG